MCVCVRVCVCVCVCVRVVQRELLYIVPGLSLFVCDKELPVLLLGFALLLDSCGMDTVSREA